MDQLICASLSHPHYWYELGIMLKVPPRSTNCYNNIIVLPEINTYLFDSPIRQQYFLSLTQDDVHYDYVPTIDYIIIIITDNNSGWCEKREEHNNWSIMKIDKAAPVTGTTLRPSDPAPAASQR